MRDTDVGSLMGTLTLALGNNAEGHTAYLAQGAPDALHLILDAVTHGEIREALQGLGFGSELRERQGAKQYSTELELVEAMLARCPTDYV